MLDKPILRNAFGLKKEPELSEEERRYLALLAKSFPSQQAAYTEIINLEAIINLPKGVEHFISDVHGEAQASEHILNNCSGVIRERVDSMYISELTQQERDDLCTLIYYPKERLRLMHRQGTIGNVWYESTLMLLV